MKKNIALLAGGYSGEYEISIKTAVTIANNLDANLYNVFKIIVTKESWLYTADDGHEIAIDKNDFSLTINSEKIKFDAVFIAIHGTPGEDGKLQGYFDMLGLPYTSCDAATSALTFNKRYTVAVAAFGGISVANSMHLFKHTPVSPENILAKLQLPVFVKPNNGGSSIGMSKVSTADALAPALEKAFKEDSQVLVEEFISGREFTIGVFKTKGTLQVLPITEIETGNEFFDFEAKYQGKSVETTPAFISETIQSQLEAAAKRVYEVLNCRGVVRIDFIYNEQKGLPYMLEVNTVPGQSAASVIPQQVKAMGASLQDFYTSIVEESLN